MMNDQPTSQEILINITLDEIRVAVLENTIPQEIYIERAAYQDLTGNIYKGRVTRLLPGLNAAFVDIGLEKPAFLHMSDMLQLSEVNEVERYDIRNFLVVNQEVIVQIYKDMIGTKGARLTTQFSIPSRYLVFTPGCFQISVSQKITDESERLRLLELLKPDEHGGYIFRTAAEGISAANLQADQVFLKNLWQDICKNKKSKAPSIIYEELPLHLKLLRDLAAETSHYKVEKILVDDEEIARKMQEFALQHLPSLTNVIQYYAEDIPLFEKYQIDATIQKSLQRKVFLKSGGHVVFDQTEAMTTIDVNTGSSRQQSKIEEFILKTNLEAIDVIVQQLRLRNLGGIIIIDFVDMHSPQQKEIVMSTLATALLKDNAKNQISELTSLGLVQLTRKRARESLEHILCETCPTCHRRGSIKSYATLYHEVIRDLTARQKNTKAEKYLVLVSRDTYEYFSKNYLNDLQKIFAMPIQLQAEDSYQREQYHILPT